MRGVAVPSTLHDVQPRAAIAPPNPQCLLVCHLAMPPAPCLLPQGGWMPLNMALGWTTGPPHLPRRLALQPPPTHSPGIRARQQ